MIDQVWESMRLLTAKANQVRLFMDYDGTLADFAPSPDYIQPDQALLPLLARLVANKKYLTTVISGRSLQHLQELLPVDGLFLAGTYGLEIQMPDGSRINTLEFEKVRPLLQQLRPKWQALIDGQSGFHLEDKGWTLALHARFAALEEAKQVLDAAYHEIENLSPGAGYAIEHRDRFLEIGPVEANKRRSVGKILAQYTPSGALPVYIGDDLNDENAFGAVLEAGGLCVRVSSDTVDTRAQYRLAGPAQVRKLLQKMGSDE